MDYVIVSVLVFIIILQAILIYILYENNTRHMLPFTVFQNASKQIKSSNGSPTSYQNESSLLILGTKYKTDKVFFHHYEPLYEKYLSQYRNKNFKLLEIGLGCGQQFGVGASAIMWREYFGELADIHYIEFDQPCGELWFKNSGGQQVSSYFLSFIKLDNKYYFLCNFFIFVAQCDNALW